MPNDGRAEKIDAPSPAGKELLTGEDLAGLLQVSVRTLFRLRARGVLPAPVEISTNIVRWRMADVRAYLDGLQPRARRPSSIARCSC
jgi:predicted DNA-binding transcriptional regulator AlpA